MMSESTIKAGKKMIELHLLSACIVVFAAHTDPGYMGGNFPCLTAFEGGLPFLEEGFEPLLDVLGGAGQPEEIGLVPKSFV